MAKNKKIRKITPKRNQISNTPVANRKYKDTVFRMLFSDKENLLSLYNAINGTTYENSEDLDVVTLKSAIYIILIFRCEICFTYRQNIRNW